MWRQTCTLGEARAKLLPNKADTHNSLATIISMLIKILFGAKENIFLKKHRNVNLMEQNEECEMKT